MFVSLLLVFVSDKLPSLENLSIALLPCPPATPLTRETDREVKYTEKERGGGGGEELALQQEIAYIKTRLMNMCCWKGHQHPEEKKNCENASFGKCD